jgi:ferredoxin
MNVINDRTTCVSCGSCWDTCPALFEQDPEDSFSRIVEQYRLNGNRAEGTPPLDLEPCARDAADLCQVQIIRIENG